MLANTLARAGVGHLRIVDRDFLELNNLQRQVLYDEEDVAAGLPKAVAAEAKLRKINSQISIEAIVADVDHTTIGRLLEGVDVIVDGTDNFETRFLLNDAAVKFGIPWVYGGCVGTEGQTMTILPGETPCLRCLLQDAPPPGSTATCDSAGILAPIVNIIASLEACEAIKILSGHREAISRSLQVVRTLGQSSAAGETGFAPRNGPLPDLPPAAIFPGWKAAAAATRSCSAAGTPSSSAIRTGTPCRSTRWPNNWRALAG